MEHILYSDGNAKRISWVIKTNESVRKQFRDHADVYLDKVNDLQAKYIALHVGIFWSIGVFVIKNHDTIRVRLDSEEMLSHLKSDERSTDDLAERRKGFIKQLANQRDLIIIYERTSAKDNLATDMLRSENVNAR